MNKKKKHRLEKRWWAFCHHQEEILDSVMFVGDGAFFILLLPLWIILDMIQWLMYLIGCWMIKKIPTTD